MIYPALITSVIGWRGATLLGLLSKIKHVYVCNVLGVGVCAGYSRVTVDIIDSEHKHSCEIS